MTTIATGVCLGLSLALALVTGVQALRDRAPRQLELLGAGVVELGVLFYVGVRAVGLADGHHVSSVGLVVAYLIGMALIMPIAAALGLAEPSRWGNVVIGVGALVVAVLLARIGQLWTPPHA